MKRIYSIDFLKLVMAISIALYHYKVNTPISTYAVTFFFVISGVFLAKKYYSKKDKDYSGYEYTKDHIKSLYPHYLLSLVILLIATISLDVVSAIKNTSILVIFKDAFVKLYRALPEFFLLQNIGFYDGGINYPLWQVCTLLIAGYFIYTFLKKNEKMTIQLICPISVISIYTLLYINKVEAFGFYGFIYFPLLRAFGPMCLGVLIYRFIISNDYEKLLKSKYHVLLNIFSLLSLIFLFVCNAYGYNYLILFVIIILELFNEKSLINKLLNRKIFSSFGDLSYAI